MADSSENICSGDRVRVEFGHGKPDLLGDVIYIPCQPGDSWVIRSRDRVNYIQQFVIISKQIEVTTTQEP